MFKIVLATKNYAPQIHELEKELFLDSAYSLNSVLEELESSSRVYLVALNENENVVAYIGVNVVENDAEIMKVGVTSNLQGKGIASLLFNKLFEILKSKNVNNVFLEVNEHNLKAINLYTKLGFSKISVRKNYYHGTDSALIFSKTI